MSSSHFDPEGSSSRSRLYIQVRYRRTLRFNTCRRHQKSNNNLENVYFVGWGHAVAQLVEALRYKSEGRGFDPR